jgi:hypothetical protein
MQPENQAYIQNLCPAQGRICFPIGKLSITDLKNSFFLASTRTPGVWHRDGIKVADIEYNFKENRKAVEAA